MSKRKITAKGIKNPANKHIIDEFLKLISQIKYDMDNAPTKKDALRHSYRLRQIKNVVKILKKYPQKIKSGEQVADIKGIGKGTINRINEIIKTGKLKEIKTKKELAEYLGYIDELEKVFGIGRKIAKELVTEYNIKSVPELIKAHKAGEVELNEQILTGLKYYGVYKQNIPRQEIDKIDNYIHKIAKKVDIELFYIIAGSYRRKLPMSNDIDILVTHPDIKTKSDISKYHNYMIEFVKKLKEDGFLVDDLTYENYETKYMGFCQLKIKGKKYPVRRIDIRYVPDDSYYTSLIYFTGSRDFNINLRNLALNLGYTLNEYGLYKGKKRIKIESENDLFKKLGLEYVPPEFR